MWSVGRKIGTAALAFSGVRCKAGISRTIFAALGLRRKIRTTCKFFIRSPHFQMPFGRCGFDSYMDVEQI